MILTDLLQRGSKYPLHQFVYWIFLQPQVSQDWLVFKKNYFHQKPETSGMLFGFIVFVLLQLYCHDSKRLFVTKSIQKNLPHVQLAKLTFADPLRMLIQFTWLASIQSATPYKDLLANLNFFKNIFSAVSNVFFYPLKFLTELTGEVLANIEFSANSNDGDFKPHIYLIIIFLLALVCLTIPFNISSQLVFVFLMWFVAMSIRTHNGYLPKLILVILSLTLSSRYLFWRATATINTDSSVDTVTSLILFTAEFYTWLILLLGYFQIAGPLQRKTYSLPNDTNLWPTVDIFIPTYNEDIGIVKTTTIAAINIDWPKDKIKIYILDDGNRHALQDFANEIHVGYISRTNNIHAKAGNINNAMQLTEGEYLTIFDCDHIPVRSFLQTTMGWFIRDEKLALIQTPHHFYSPDPFERNLNNFKKTPNENSLFYGVVQDGNDLWNAAFFCGSCAILKRSPLTEIGGIAHETVTEDAHTALKLHRKGYTSAYINIIQAAGQATESLSAHIGQRIRWSRGMAQIFRIDNPLLGKGLKISQRLCYANAMLHFFGGIPRLIFLIAPLAFLIIHAYIIHAPTVEILLYALPAIIHSNLANSYMQGKHRYSFWSEIYEAVLAWYIAVPTTVALFKPKVGTFNVTAKGGLIKDEFFDLTVSKPYLMLISLNVIGLIFGVYRFFNGPDDELSTVIINVIWAIYNLLVLGGAISVAQETKQLRLHHRIDVKTDITLRKKSGHLLSAKMNNFSDAGLGVQLYSDEVSFDKNESIHVLISRGDREYIFPARIASVNKLYIGIILDNLTANQKQNFIKCNYSRSDAWSAWEDNFDVDKPLSSFLDIVTVGFKGYVVLTRSIPRKITKYFIKGRTFLFILKTFYPRNIHADTINL
ncbi:MAG: UDP-forming cellulose synthase catalytic subunit [Methylococcales bacterium]|nr:UDP-forming cellulose synthase catalytic subunit [Methylococcales bacterium]